MSFKFCEIFKFILLFSFFCQQTFGFSFISRNLCQRSEKNSQNFSQKLIEKIKEISNNTLCESNINCRSYQEIIDIAACKSSRFANELTLDKDLYYILTWYKPKALHEWAKFIYAIVENKNTNVTPYQGNIQFIKVCIPVNAEKKGYIDEKCPLDDCIEKCSKNETACVNQVKNEEVKTKITEILGNITSIKKYI